MAADEAVLKYFSQTGRLTDSVWGGGLGSGGRATTPPRHSQTDRCHPVLQWRDFSETRIFVVDDDSRLFATGSVRRRTEFL